MAIIELFTLEKIIFFSSLAIYLIYLKYVISYTYNFFK